jgi:hypothetical protein
MNVDPRAHAARPWRVHTLAPDFELLEVWRFDLDGELVLSEVLDCFWSVFASTSNTSMLSRVRDEIGRRLGWDDHDFTLPIPGFTLPIPGCAETNVAARLTAADRERSRTPPGATPGGMQMLRSVYVFDDEALYEASNDTIHLMLHVGLLDRAISLGVYFMSRGLFTRFYMALFAPLRRAIIFPRLRRRLDAAWKARRA